MLEFGLDMALSVEDSSQPVRKVVMEAAET